MQYMDILIIHSNVYICLSFICMYILIVTLFNFGGFFDQKLQWFNDNLQKVIIIF